MSPTTPPSWLAWAREIQALSQTGLAFSQTEYDTERYQRLSAIAAEIVARHTDLNQDAILQGFRTQPGYATVKVDVRGAILRNNQILLVQERRDRKWCMPGGWADVGETPSEMIAREIIEESGFKAQAQKIIGIYDANRGHTPLEFFHAYKIVFLCKILGGHPQTSNETMAVDFFDFDKLPPLSTDRTNERHLADVQAFIQDPQRPAVFD